MLCAFQGLQGFAAAPSKTSEYEELMLEEALLVDARRLAGACKGL